MRFKLITPANVFETDDSIEHNVTIDMISGQIRSPEDWVHEVSTTTLHSAVVRDVRESFECARGALCYGSAYHPLLTIAAHDLLRVADFATVAACSQRLARKRTFAQRIAYLVSLGVIERADAAAWTEIRLAHHRVTHPTSDTIFGFAAALRLLRSVRDVIDRIAWFEDRHET